MEFRRNHCQLQWFNIQAGFELTVEPAGGGTPTKSYTITDIQATADDATNTVSGIASLGARVQVCVNLPTGGCLFRWATADATTGQWSVSFTSSSDPQDDTATYTLMPGDSGWAAESNDSGDQTQVGWHVLDPNIQAQVLNGSVAAFDWVDGTSLNSDSA